MCEGFWTAWNSAGGVHEREKMLLQPGRNDVRKGGYLRMKAFVESVLDTIYTIGLTETRNRGPGWLWQNVYVGPSSSQACWPRLSDHNIFSPLSYTILLEKVLEEKTWHIMELDCVIGLIICQWKKSVAKNMADSTFADASLMVFPTDQAHFWSRLNFRSPVAQSTNIQRGHLAKKT